MGGRKMKLNDEGGRQPFLSCSGGTLSFSFFPAFDVQLGICVLVCGNAVHSQLQINGNYILTYVIFSLKKKGNTRF